MLKLLRKYSRSWVIAVAIGAIVVVFIFWGLGGLQSPRFQEVASVNGEPSFLASFIQRYNLMVKDVQDRAKGQLSEEQFKAMGLKDVALNQLIDEVLKLQAARRLGIEVSTPELQEHIRSLPYFQEVGRFSERRYQAILARARVKPGDFESGEPMKSPTSRVSAKAWRTAAAASARLMSPPRNLPNWPSNSRNWSTNSA